MTSVPEPSANIQRDLDECVRSRRQHIEWTNRVFKLASSTAPSSTRHELILVENRLCLRPLLQSEVQVLVTVCQCKARDWHAIRLLLSTEHAHLDASHALRQLVSRSNFQGSVVLVMPGVSIMLEEREMSRSSNESSPYLCLEPGVHNNILVKDCILHLDGRIYDNTLVERTFVGSNAVLIKCGTVFCGTKRMFGSLDVSVGAESGGGRKLALHAEFTMIPVCEQLTQQNQKSLNDAQSDETHLRSGMNILCAHSLLCNTPTVDGVFLLPKSTIDSATCVSNAVLFGAAKIHASASATNVILQWHASISNQSTVSDAMIMEHAHVGPHSLVTQSVLGPDVHVSAGEIHASVVGPNTNAHHQSLLIGVLWPMGRGNVGYGANVGSNHTGRLPDQEAVAGEGIFWGLSTAIKFPVDFSGAPYSIVAAGTQLGPQRIRMPFSLIVADEVNGGNSIIPGWILYSSPYTLARSEIKYATRRKAIHHNYYTGWKIFRREVIEQCLWARQSLRNVDATVYIADRDVPGIGTARLTEKARLSGIKAYDECICRFALQGLLEFVEQHIEHGSRCLESIVAKEFASAASLSINDTTSVEWNTFPWQACQSKEWRVQKSVIVNEYPNAGGWVKWTLRLLKLYATLEKSYAANVFECKYRDDIRGAEIIPGYANGHVAAQDDAVIKATRTSARAIEAKVARLYEKLCFSVPESKL
ncbi:hypothetical protein MPSEU_000994100 [Mayamaea pseudoterrestris]|nr:hypothetical protein MPSEU_000994100 [Mayamaea pseudoterrestris]